MRSRSTRIVAALGLAALVLTSSAQAQTTYDTAPLWDGFSSISPFGNSNTATYGQTFIAPTDNRLDSFSFHVQPDPGVTLQFKAMVFAWTGSLIGDGGGQATGPALFTSPSMSISDNGAFQQVLVLTGGVVLTPGAAYVALLTCSDPTDYAGTTGVSVWGNIEPGGNPNNGGGGFVFFNNGNDFGALGTDPWDNFADFGDLAWTAHFNPAAVPEGSSLMLFGGGMIGSLLVSVRRRRKS